MHSCSGTELKKRFYGVKGIIMLCHGGAKNEWGRGPKTYKQIKTALHIMALLCRTRTRTRTVGILCSCTRTFAVSEVMSSQL